MAPIRQRARRAFGRLAVPRLAHQRVRVYESVRTAHLERARSFRPASILYAGERYDFDPVLAAGVDLHRVGALRLAAALLANPVDGLELNEPLQRSGLRQAAIAVTAVWLSAGLRSARTSRPVVGAYAIENRDPFADAPPRLRSRLRRAVELRLSRYVAHRLDRIAYGTDGARDLYRQRLGAELAKAEQRLQPALPAACTCDHPAPVEGAAPTVIYLGALHTRKGVRELLAAWPSVAEQVPAARLVVVGKGELEAEVRAVAKARADVELVVDPPRPEIHRRLREADTLVLFSQRSPRWREQVGLPIVEGLAHGCRIVSSSETGLADWLTAHGHQVLSPDAAPEALAAAIRASLDDPRRAADVVADLPAEDGRQVADDWLLHGIETADLTRPVPAALR